MQRPLLFTSDGVLPLGDHPLTLNQLAHSILVTGPQLPEQPWDVRWRMHLVSNLAILIQQLWRVGIDRIYIDGSFVEEKAHPNDIDGYFECDLRELASGRLAQALNKLDPYGVWTWHPASRRSAPDSAKKQLPMWHQYRVELYPDTGQPSGILDQFGNNLPFAAAFRMSRQSYRPKGIVRIIK